jgi:hypothetical protein
LIIGLDVSTSIVGIGIVQLDGKLGSLDYVNLKKEKSLFKKAIIVSDHLKQYKGIITEVAIEEPLIMFQPGFSRAQVLSRLSTFNGMIAIISFMVFEIEPTYYNVLHARKIALPNLKFPQGSDRKQLILDAVSEMNPGIVWPRKKSGKHAIQCYDMADGFVVGLCHYKSLQSLTDDSVE